MAKQIINEPSRTLMEYRLLPGLTTLESTTPKISLRTPLVYSPNNEKKFYLNIPLVSAAMQSVSGAEMGIELARLGGAAFVFCSQTSEDQAKMVKDIKSFKAGFVKPQTMFSDLKIKDMYKIRRETGHSSFPVVDENGVFLGLITKWDYDITSHEVY